MTPADRSRLTSALRDHTTRLAEDLRLKLRGPARTRALALHADEQVGDDFDVWTDLLSRRAAVLWVLKSVYCRVLEDRGLITPGRILDAEAQQLFERLAPNLGETAFLRWVYRDLASPRGGLPELFATQPAELAAPADHLSRELLAFWRHKDPDTGAQWSFQDERFQGELMGDLYQELDPVVKDRFALCQTPDFVRAFILDRTLTPAIAEFGADTVRLLDPACGSGHFLIDGLERLVTATALARPDWDRPKVVAHALDRVVGIDLNDYACALARARLVMTAAELAGVSTLAAAARFHPHVYWADALEQFEKTPPTKGLQLDLMDPSRDEPPRASLSRPEVRSVLNGVLSPRFHAVVANPPYITEKDSARKSYHREKLGREPRYVSAYRQYSLGSPFTERCFQLAVPSGYVGIITSNNFMKREFGKPLIEKVLAGLDLGLVIDSSQAYIPFHGTPTVLLFGNNRRAKSDTVRAVMGKRGESGTPDDPAHGQVWTSIVEGFDTPGFENEYISVSDLPRETLKSHPWSLGGGGAAELKDRLEQTTTARLGAAAESIGFMCITKQDEVFVQDAAVLRRLGSEADWVRAFGMGDMVRDWTVAEGPAAVFPYDERIALRPLDTKLGVARYLWRYRRILEERAVFGGQTFKTSGRAWWEYGQIPTDRFRTPLSIAFAFVATHNHFVLDRGGKVFKQSAPVIKLPPGATEDDHLALLGLLNSSTACFWMKQVFHAKAAGGIGRGLEPEPFMERYEFDATKMKLFPVVAHSERSLPYAARLDALARGRSARSVASLLASDAWNDATQLKHRLAERLATDLHEFELTIALQEELDWLAYQLYGLDEGGDLVPPDAVEPMPPTWLPWCLNLAESDAEIRDALARGEETADLPTVWFERHGWEPLDALPAEASPALRARVEARRARIAASAELSLIETANFKRRWYRPDHATEERLALELWLAERVEAAAQARARPSTVEQLASALQDDPRVLAVCEVLHGRPDFSLSRLVEAALNSDSVPNSPAHTYKPAGLVKRAAWERMWEEQRREDAGEEAAPEIPPSYGTGDFLKTDYWKLRGKLDVPKERFIAFTEVPTKVGADTLYGWAGWTPIERIRALLGIDEGLEDEGVPLSDRIGVLNSAWRLLPDAAREDASAAARLKAELQALVGTEGPSPEVLKAWQTQFPPPGTRSSRKRRK